MNRTKRALASGAGARYAVQCVKKARSNYDSVQQRRQTAVRMPGVFRPPYGGTSYFGRAYRWETALHYRLWAFVAIKAWINEIAGGAPINLGTVKPAEAHRTKRVNKALGGPREHEEFVPYPHDHPLQQVFRKPNSQDVSFDLWAYTILFLKLIGQSHWWVIRNDWGVPVEIWVVPGHWTQLETGADGEPAYWWIMSPWGFQTHVPFDEMVTFYEHSPLNRFEGHPVSLAINEWIDCYEAKTRMQLATFKNGAVPAFHIALGEAYGDPDEAFLNRFYSKWFARFQGEDNSGKPLITGPDVSTHAIEGHRPTDALRVAMETEPALRDMVLAGYGVNKGVVGIDPASDTSAYAAQRSFARFSVNPLLKFVGEIVQEKVIKVTPNCEDGVAFFDDRVAADVEAEERKLEWDLDHGVRTHNEVRTVRGLQAYPYGGDNPIVGKDELLWQTGRTAEPIKDLGMGGGDFLPGGGGGGGDLLALPGGEAEALPPESEPTPAVEEPVETSLRRKPVRKSAGVLCHVDGPSGSGKTTLGEKLAKKHPQIVVRDLDDFDDAAVELLGWEEKRKDDYDDGMLATLAKVRQRLMDEWLERQTKPVVLVGHAREGTRWIDTHTDAQFVLDVDAKTSAERAYRRSQNEKPEHRRLRSEMPMDVEEAQEDIDACLARGYESASPEQVEQWVAAQLVGKSVRKGITVREAVHSEKGNTVVQAVDDETGKNVGSAIVGAKDKDGHRWTVSMVSVDHDRQRQGIASLMYRFIEQKYGVDIVPSATQTPSGEAFSQNRERALGASNGAGGGYLTNGRNHK